MTKLDAAKKMLSEILAGGPQLQVEVARQLEAAGIKRATWKRAKLAAGVVSIKKGRWSWALPHRL